MGFFSSRQAENDVYQATLGGGNKSVVQVIRSRFYGKGGKEREDQQPRISFLGGVSAAQALSNNNHHSTSYASTTNRSERRSHINPSLFRKISNDATPPTPSINRPKDSPPPSTSPSPLRRRITDNATVTLAQRLDELATANSDGLLNDDEYRLLRQNLFERFASHSAAPTEASIVPVVSARPVSKSGMQTLERQRPISSFQITASRPTSISASSSVASLFRRATRRRAVPKHPSDASSVRSGTSNNSSIFRLPQILSKKSSDSSIYTNASRIQTDTVSISPRQPYSSSNPTQLSLRSTASIRRLTTPPSSFPSHIIGQDSRTNSIYNIFDEEHLNSVKEITQEIQNVEVEAKRLMDAFSGLELTTLAKLQRHHVRPSLKSAEFRQSISESHWGPDSESRSRRIFLADDAMSMRSGTSAGTAPSISASFARTAQKKPTWNTKPVSLGSRSLHRKNSMSSLTSERTNGQTLPNSISHGHLGVNLSNVSLLKSTGHLPMDTVLEDEKMPMSESATVKLEAEYIENEIEDIRRRRGEVSLRYEARLEYLRAKLKGAQLHEQLMRQ